MSKFFDFYKNSSFIIKILLFAIFAIMAILWVIGSLTKIDRLVMFMIGLIVGGALINIFLYDYVSDAINYLTSLF